eukprot:TRINITY_DN49329_c0_g1_i1.p1 TRINITY_DN49329_c0_g1~~TRINITY_DN49329_c0_g1_i1.p1  ORF type:complete len:385 (-),score=48.92 TRINITY_DN49329_c0_g1_i1:81-1100(-)
MASGCYVGVRVGDVLKQGRYEPQRVYHFPSVERRRNAKIDLYQHMGSCLVSVDPDTRAMHEVAVTKNDPRASPLRLKVNVQAASADIGKQREKRAQAVKCQAKEYLAKHGIEDRLSEAVKALLKLQPNDPTDFLCRYLRGDSQPQDGKHSLVADKLSPVKNASPPQRRDQSVARSAPMPMTLIPFRSYYSNNVRKVCAKSFWDSAFAKFPSWRAALAQGGASKDFGCLRAETYKILSQACLDGSLSKAFSDVRQENKAKTLQPTVGVDEMRALRLRACDLLRMASMDGELCKVLSRVSTERSAARASSGRRAASSARPMIMGGNYFHMAYGGPTRFMCL